MTFVAVGVLVSLTLPAGADTLRFMNGTEIDGTFLGGDTRTIRFLGEDGEPKTYRVTDVSAVEFGDAAVAAPAANPAATQTRQAPSAAGIGSSGGGVYAPGPASSGSSASAAEGGVTIPSGTVITARMIDSIDVRVTAVGERFRASIDDPVVIDDQVVIPRGADCTVQIMRAETAGRVAGSDELAIRLFDVTVNGEAYETATAYAELKSDSQTRETIRNTGVMAGVGAAIGAIAGGGTGAAIGAAAGGGAGLGASMIKGPHLRVPSETRLSFELRAPLPLE
jgi:hypothetical protein